MGEPASMLVMAAGCGGGAGWQGEGEPQGSAKGRVPPGGWPLAFGPPAVTVPPQPEGGDSGLGLQHHHTPSQHQLPL